MLEFEKRQWIAELKTRTAREKMLEADERFKEAKLKVEEWEARITDQKERDRKREAERELPPRRSSGLKFIHRMRCFECGATTHIQINCPQLLGKTPFKPEANVSRVGVGVLWNEPALKEQSLGTSVCEQCYSDYGIASLFDCAMPSASKYDLDKPNVDMVILQNNTVSINAEAPVSFVTAELSSLKYVDICLST